MTRSASRLERIVRSGAFCVTSEVVPPRSGSGAGVTRRARELVGYADAVNVTDNPTASAHMSPLAGASFVAAAGLEPTLQITCRDRNRLGLSADLLGGWALGARNLLCLTGDPTWIGDHPETPGVFDLSVNELVGLAARLRSEGLLLSGAEVEDPPSYFIGVADVPLTEGYDVGRLEGKLDAGADFVMTQIVYDVEALAAWAERVRPSGVLERAAFIVGVSPPRSAKSARYMNEHLPGVRVPDEVIAALEEAGPDAEAVGVGVAIEIVRRLREIRGVSGVHLTGPGQGGAVAAVVEGAGLLPRPAASA